MYSENGANINSKKNGNIIKNNLLNTIKSLYLEDRFFLQNRMRLYRPNFAY